ncbi:hypothetical protein [Lacticaseibacillus sp. N501-2]|uniref:hypothetical protein n=1 Tax=Lacticaseibacillus salsurae TaxID=3367729 RepID=UPI0038B27993
MKKVIAGLMMSVTVLGLATATTGALSVHAATTDPAKTENKATLTVEAGTLSLTQPADVDFGKANVGDVYTNGLENVAGTPDGTTTVSDFLGDNGEWTLNVTASGFNGALGANDASTVSVTPNTATKAITVGTEATPVTTGGAGETPVTLGYKLDVKKHTLLTAGTYTNTLTWNLSNTPGANADTPTDN